MMTEDQLKAHARYHELLSYGHREYAILENLETGVTTYFFDNSEQVSICSQQFEHVPRRNCP